MADLSKYERFVNAQKPHTIRPTDHAIARKVKAILDANEGRSDIEIMLALSEASHGYDPNWLAEIRHQAPRLAGVAE